MWEEFYIDVLIETQHLSIHSLYAATKGLENLQLGFQM